MESQKKVWAHLDDAWRQVEIHYLETGQENWGKKREGRRDEISSEERPTDKEGQTCRPKSDAQEEEGRCNRSRRQQQRHCARQQKEAGKEASRLIQ